MAQRSLPFKDFEGEVFSGSSINKIRIHPVNSDLLLISGEMSNPTQATPADPHKGVSSSFCLYEIHSRRRVLITPPNMFAQDGEWSRDGLQIFFTGSDPARRPSVYRIS